MILPRVGSYSKVELDFDPGQDARTLLCTKERQLSPGLGASLEVVMGRLWFGDLHTQNESDVCDV